MAGHGKAAYLETLQAGWLTWKQLEEQVGPFEGNLRRTARQLIEEKAWPDDLPRPVFFAFSGQGGDALYHPRSVEFLRDIVVLQPHAHLRGQRHSVETKTQPHAPLLLLLAARGWTYDTGVIRQSIATVVEQFRALTENSWSVGRLGRWLFTGLGIGGRVKRAAYWRGKAVSLMRWLSLLADVPIDDKAWEHIGARSWDPVLHAIDKADPAIVHAWLVALRPVVDGWCFPSKQPETAEEIREALARPVRPDPDHLRRENVTTQIFRLLNRRLEAAFDTRPGDVDRWEKIRKKLGHKLPEPVEFGRFTWYDARLFDSRTRTVIFEIPKAKPLYYPQNIEEVLARFLRYAGVFAALGIATYDPSEAAPAAPLPAGRSLEYTCRFCNIKLHAAVVNGEPRVWCPRCFTESPELAAILMLKMETQGTHMPASP